MSVINKMLRDLDRRQADKIAFQVEDSGVEIAQGIFPQQIPPSAGSKQGLTRFGIVLIGFFVLLLATGGCWYLLPNDLLSRRVNPSSVPFLSPVKAELALNTVVPGTTPAASNFGANSSPLNAALADISLKMDSTLNWIGRQENPMRIKVAATPLVPAPAAAAIKLNERAPQEKIINPAVVPSVAATAVSQSPPRRAPALDALAQAQSLWNAGSRDAAIELVSEALAVVERAPLTGTASGNTALLSSLARELARMEMAEGRIKEALKMLTRLEPALSGVADVWAMRGNAAQRLGKHEESVAAYRSALKLRPNEPRWMLGAAVSLAAQGQTDGAAELSEKARAAGVLSPEVAAYLRQLDVPLRDH